MSNSFINPLIQWRFLMVYNYLLELYKILDRRQEEIARAEKAIPSDHRLSEFNRGRKRAIEKFRVFLQDKYHAKLPRRLQ